MNNTQPLREHLLAQLRGNGAHVTFDEAVANLPPAAQGQRPQDSPHTPWRLLEHLRITQADALDVIRNPAHVELAFPEGYWPRESAPADPNAWQASAAAFRADLETLTALAADPSTDLFAPLLSDPSKTILRELLMLASHSSYHLGELVLLRRMLQAWP
jgi:hypothetical protein